MLQMKSKTERESRVLLALACWMTCWLAVSTFAAADVGCETAVPLDLPSQWRGVGAQADGGQLVRYEVPSASVLTLDVAVPLAASTEPVMVFLGRGCGDRREAGDFAYLEHTASHQVLALPTAGQYFVLVAPQDPALLLGDFKLTAGLVDDLDQACFNKTGNPAEDEPEPDPLAADCFNKTGNPAEDEPEPDPWSGGWCRRSELDDHGDTLTCPTLLSLDLEARGELHNDWGDDEDIFMFLLTELRTIEIETTGETDTTGALLDHFANRLAMDEDGGSGNNFRVVKTLAPGRYFVRVEGGHQAEGSFRLSVRTLNRR